MQRSLKVAEKTTYWSLVKERKPRHIKNANAVRETNVLQSSFFQKHQPVKKGSFPLGFLTSVSFLHFVLKIMVIATILLGTRTIIN